MKSEQFWRDIKGEYDLVYIDGSHKYPTCQEDIFEGWERLKDGGIFIVDDFTHPKNQSVDPDSTVEYGVSYAVCNLIKEKRIKRIDSTTRLFVAYK
jgi:predicted O-methyltransferase YrrM